MRRYNNPWITMITAPIMVGAAMLYFYTNFMVFNHASAIVGDFQEFENPTDPLAGGKLKIVNNRQTDNQRFRPGYAALARMNDIKARRFIHFSATVPLRELLRPGETPPTKSMEGVVAQTRAIFYAREECERVTKVLAKQCEVEHVKGKADDGNVHIQATLRFVQSDAFGTPDPQRTWSYQYVDTKLGKSGVTVPLRRTERARTDLYRKAAAECAAIRKREGNCAITDLSVKSRLYRNSRNEAKISGNARYSFLVPAG